MSQNDHENLETATEFSAARVAPWNRIGINVSMASNSAEAIKLAGLDWQVLQEPIRYFDGMQERTLDTWQVNYRSDTGNPIGIVSDRYTVIQNSEVFAFADPLLAMGFKYEWAGTISNGRQIWMVASHSEKRVVGDLFKSNLLLMTGHDGKNAVRICSTPIRLACANMLNLAIRQATCQWSIQHSRLVHEKTINAARILSKADYYMEELRWRAETLAASKVSQDDIRRFVEKMFPALDTDRKNNRVKRNIERFRDCCFVADLENFKGTKWGLLLAVSDYVTHIPVQTRRRQETHFVRMVEGHELLDKAYTLVNML